MHHPVLAKIGDRIRTAREARGLTQPELAKRLETHQGTVSAWELGKNQISIITLVQLANVLGVTPDYLLCFTDNQASRALRHGTSFFVDHDGLSKLRAARSHDEIRSLVQVVKVQVGAEVPANWTEVSEAEYRKLEIETEVLLGRLGPLPRKWMTPGKR